MSLARTAELVDRARRSRHGVAAFNVVGLEHAEAVAIAAERAGAAAILQVSANAIAFRGALEPLAAGLRAIAKRAGAPLALHLDHAEDEALCRRAADAGFSSVMFDAADRPDAANMAATAALAAWGHGAGLWVEGELGVVGGKPGVVSDGMTDPAAAAAYVRDTGVDGLAVAVGSEHKLPRREAALDLPRIAALRASVDAALVLHGASGVPDATLTAAVAAGMVKVNVGTRLGMAYLAGFDAARGAEDADPRRALGGARAAMVDAAAAVIAAVVSPKR